MPSKSRADDQKSWPPYVSCGLKAPGEPGQRIGDITTLNASMTNRRTMPRIRVVQTKPTQVKINVTILNELGLHARPAMAFVDLAHQFESDIRVSKGAHQVDGKSIMHMITLAATQGTELVIEADGPDALEATARLQSLVDNRFEE